MLALNSVLRANTVNLNLFYSQTRFEKVSLPECSETKEKFYCYRMSVPPKLCLEVRLQEVGKPALHRELKRLQSFNNWPYKSTIKPSDLARNGFYYNGSFVRCVYCGLYLNWQEVTDIMEVHKKYSKECNFVLNRPCGNISISHDSNESSDEKADYFIGGILMSEYKHLSRDTGPNFSFLQPAASNWENNFGHLFECRLETFENWPKPEIQDPIKLAVAGFYYTGKDDETVCFYCKNGLKNWICTQHPLVEHAYFFPTCSFVQIEMGINLVGEARAMHFLLKNEKIKPGNTTMELVENFRKWSFEDAQSK